MKSLYDLPFDQYQRYRLVSSIVEELREGERALSILDVGGRTALLRRFLARDRVTLVDLEPSAEPGLVLGDGAALPFADASFDLVCAFDTLEHVPPPLRARFVSECARVTRHWVVLAGPYQAPEVEEAEQLLQSFLREKLGVQHRYLEEHRHNGLPDRAATEAALAAHGARVVALGHGNVQRWLALISLAMYMDHTPQLQALATRLHRFYNRGLFASDDEEPVYRHALVAAFRGAALPEVHRRRPAARAPGRELLHFAQELAAFDAHRDAYQAEWSRLEGVIRGLEADLSGHKQSLADLRAQRDQALASAQVLTRELEETRRSLSEVGNRRDQAEAAMVALRADLEGHQKSLAESGARRAEAESVIRALESDLAGHRRALEELRALRAESEVVIAALETDLAGHKGTLQDLSSRVARYEDLLAEHRTVIGDRERELERHGRVLDELRANLAALDAEQAKILDLRESDRHEFESVRGELEREIGSLQTVREELQREVEARQAHAQDLEQSLVREHQAFEAEQARLREEREAVARSWQAEREAFERVVAEREQELERHRAVREELRASLAALDAEHARVLALRQKELQEFEEERGLTRRELEALRTTRETELAELAALRATREKELAELDLVRRHANELEEHLAREHAAFDAELARLSAERAAAEKVRTSELAAWAGERRAFEGTLAERRRELEEHRQLVQARERELADYRKVAADLSIDLEGHRDTVRALRAEEAELRAELQRRADELAQRAADLAATQAELARTQAELGQSRAEIAGARTEIASAARALEEKEALITRLRAELRNRWRSLRRAFGPRRPTPGE